MMPLPDVSFNKVFTSTQIFREFVEDSIIQYLKFPITFLKRYVDDCITCIHAKINPKIKDYSIGFQLDLQNIEKAS